MIKHGLDWIGKTWINNTWSDKTWILMCLQFIATSTFTVSTQPFLAFNPTFAK